MTIWIITIILILLIIYLRSRNSENFTTALSATEAVQNLTSLYNNGTLTATNILATGNISANNSMTIPGAFGMYKSALPSPNAGDINWGDGTGWKLNMGKPGNPSMQVYDNGNVQIGKANDRSLTIGTTVLGGTPNWSDISWGDGTGWRLNMGKSGSPTMQIYDNGGVIVNGFISQNLPVIGDPILENAAPYFTIADPIGKSIQFLKSGTCDVIQVIKCGPATISYIYLGGTGNVLNLTR